jgi:catechol 2,3-dioxygenase
MIAVAVEPTLGKAVYIPDYMVETPAALAYGIPAPNYRLPSATHIGRVKLQVSDLQRSLEYYEMVLGFCVLERSEDRVTLGAQKGDASLIELQERKGIRAVPRRGLLGLYHFAILLPDRASLGRLLRHLAELGLHAGMSDHFVSEAIYLQDPDNLGIEVYADRPRSEWRQENGQLSMTTVPLDVRSVLAAGGTEMWTGMPDGTTIGHVHLHVGDIGEAEAFYHNALGLDKTVWNYPGALFLSAGGYHHHLGTNIWARGAPNASDGDARLLEWEIVVPGRADVDAAATSLAASSHNVERGDGKAVTSDPWGTQVRIRS